MIPSGRGRLGAAAFYATLGLAFVAVFVVSLLFGRYPTPGVLSPAEIASDLMAARVVLFIRLPRTLCALALGAVLGASGSAMQFVFANPLVDSGFLGVSQGAAFGAALAMLAGGGRLAMLGASAAGAALALLASTGMAGRIRFGGSILRLILSGIMVSSLFSALVALVKFGADPMGALPEITYWLLGGLSGASWAGFRAIAAPAFGSVALLILLRWRISLLSLDEATASSLGAKPGPERAVVLAAAAIGVAAVTAMAGVVSWVGLVVPHVARAAAAREGSGTVPASAAIGAIFVMACDCVSRGLFPGELPLGVTTSLLGAAAFFAMASSRRVFVARG